MQFAAINYIIPNSRSWRFYYRQLTYQVTASDGSGDRDFCGQLSNIE